MGNLHSAAACFVGGGEEGAVGGRAWLLLLTLLLLPLSRLHIQFSPFPTYKPLRSLLLLLVPVACCHLRPAHSKRIDGCEF